MRTRHAMGLRGLACAMAALVVTACRSSGWPEENVREFTDACLANARRARPTAPGATLVSYCDCAADRLQARYTLADVERLEALGRRTGKTSPELLNAVEACATARPAP